MSMKNQKTTTYSLDWETVVNLEPINRFLLASSPKNSFLKKGIIATTLF